ncbi:SIR2 family NAD-dependent protein deacylase [Chitinophaga sp. 22620]|uniref:SIR2 family NAD-dependent protein deacylase n=1 Tax=Chitinophaga sp. 22620 TaxID=3453952 RepID=UPI003F87E487
MKIERIFELVRKEEVVLWIGSGFSLYAGYPNGRKLAEIIYNSLTSSEKSEVSPGLPLAQISEEFVRLKSGNRAPLITLLKNEFLRPPGSKIFHEILSNIPHIKTIITTNYDKLFELAYKDEIQSIIFPYEVSQISKKIELFKVHGDINHSETILLTASDYNNFYYQKKNEDLMWATIKERISNKAVVFIGYDLEDGNISNVFRGIDETLGPNRKEMFLIAPDLKAHKIDYLRKQGIQYLNFKGEPFVKKLHESIKQNIVTDYNNGYLSTDTMRIFFKKNNLGVELKSLEDRFEIKSVNFLTQQGKSRYVFEFKNNKNFTESFQSFARGESFEELRIEGKELQTFKLFLNDVNIVGDDPENYQVRLIPVPKKEGLASISFDDGSEYEDIRYRVFASKRLIEIIANYKGAEFNYKISNPALSNVSGIFSFKQLDDFANVNDAIAVLKLNINLASGKNGKIYLDGESANFNLNLGKFNLPVEPLNSSLDFFLSLKKIERIYGVKFTNVKNYSRADFDSAYKVLEFANEEPQIYTWDEELLFNIENSISPEILLNIGKGSSFISESQHPEILTILNQSIILGFQIMEPLDLYVTNLDEVLSKKSATVKVRSKSKQLSVRYVKQINVHRRITETS